MPIFYAGNYNDIIREIHGETSDGVSGRTEVSLSVETSSSESEPEDEYEEVTYGQTFPESEKVKVFRQKEGDLLCGLRCIQNMYGPHICSKEEMDSVAEELQQNSGIEMYDKTLGFYSMEVLESVLKGAGKNIQRIDIDKISPEYYIPMVEMNPTFCGYIVTVGSGDMKHYLAVRYSGRYKKIDSLPGTAPEKIETGELFKRRLDGNVYCSNNNSESPVVAVMACASSPFLEYNLLHSAWSSASSVELSEAIKNALSPSPPTDTPLPVKRFLAKWKNIRSEPSFDVYQHLLNNVCQQVASEKDVIVHYGEQQTVVRCKTKADIINELKKMQWVTDMEEYSLTQNDEDGIDWSKPFYLTKPQHPQIGGFYTFRSCVVGTCTEKTENAYSVRDQDGTIHVLYKKSIENVKQ